MEIINTRQWLIKNELQKNDINPGVDAYITNPNMKTADAYIQALQETTITLVASIRMLAGPRVRKLMRKELKAKPRARTD